MKGMKKPGVLLHICCAPDSTAVFERLSHGFEVHGFFHNPNIHPAGEYQKRLAEARKVAREMGFPLLVPAFDPEAWDLAVRGLEEEPEGGDRCLVCFRVNLRATARMAREMGIPFFTTTLTISPHKDSERILGIGRDAGAEFGVGFLGENFKKRDGFKRSLELSRNLALYRQEYCGCRFSQRKDDPRAGTP
jgi:hypothetical protein